MYLWITTKALYNDEDDDLQQLDYTKLRYTLYVRKYTDDESKQLRSLEDQIAECEVLAERLGIRLVKPYLREKKSAKMPNNRPMFTQILKDIWHGKYDGIVAWHPDRLARNMREGGEIIDMLDEKILKDLRFVTHYFTNDANGKMLLDMAFVFSKHYSDDLSQKVTRGVHRSFQEGAVSSQEQGFEPLKLAGTRLEKGITRKGNIRGRTFRTGNMPRCASHVGGKLWIVGQDARTARIVPREAGTLCGRHHYFEIAMQALQAERTFLLDFQHIDDLSTQS